MEDIKTNAIKNLKDIKSILDSLNISFWLDAGTLLGAYRDKNFCEGDEDDIDLSCFYSDIENKINKITSEAEKLGFVLYHKWKYQIALKRGGSKIDLFYHRKFNNYYVHFLYKRVSEVKETGIYERQENGTLWLAIPAINNYKYFDSMSINSRYEYTHILKLKFYDMDFNIPSLVEEYLTNKYGDWKTPVHRKDYAIAGGCYNPEVNKVLKPNFFY